MTYPRPRGIFDVEKGKFFEKTESGVILADPKQEWVMRGDLFEIDGKKVLADFGEPVFKEADPEHYEDWLKRAKYFVKEAGLD